MFQPFVNPKMQSLEDFPNGFPRVAHYLNSDDAFMIYRRFGTVFSRLLLNKQDEICALEQLLLGMDKTDEREGNDIYLKSHTKDVKRDSLPPAWQDKSRGDVMQELEKKALEYADLLLKAKELKALDRPSTKDHYSVLHFMENDGGPLVERASAFIYEKEDLITLRPKRDYAWLDEMILWMLMVTRCRLTVFLFCSKETRAKTSAPEIHYYSRERIALCRNLIITAAILALSTTTVWSHDKVSSMGVFSSSPFLVWTALLFTLPFLARSLFVAKTFLA